MKRTFEYYEIKDRKNNYGLLGTYQTAEEALAYINESYQNALAQGYDNRHEAWTIIYVLHTTEYDQNGNFLTEVTYRRLWEQVEFDFSIDSFVVAV